MSEIKKENGDVKILLKSKFVSVNFVCINVQYTGQPGDWSKECYLECFFLRVKWRAAVALGL